MALWFRVNINFYCTLKNDIALGASASCNIIFLSAIKIDIALTQVPYLYNIVPYDDRLSIKNDNLVTWGGKELIHILLLMAHYTGDAFR